MEHWRVAKSKPKKETFLISNLTRMGIETYFPHIVQPISKGRRIEPLFPTYVFCSIDAGSSRWPEARSAPGVAYFLGDGREAAPVSGEFVSHMRERVAYWNREGSHHRFSEGDRIEVAVGHFKSLDGIFIKYVPAQRRCIMLLELMGKMATVEMEESELRGVALGYGKFRL